MRTYGIQEKIIRVVQLLYQDSECAVLNGGHTSEWFKVKTGFKQGCVMSGFLFLLAIDWIMCKTTKQANTGIRWRFMDQLEYLDFADDIALISTTQHQMQRKTDKLTEAAQRVGLNISKTKIQVMRLTCKNTEPIKFQNGNIIKETKDFTYLGAVVSTEGGCDKDMNSRLRKAKAAFRKLRRIWISKQYNRRTKIRLFNTLVKPVLLYGSETQKTNVQDNRKLNSFQYQCLKRSQGIFWPYIVSVDELNERTGCTKMSMEVKKRRWRFLGHVLRMPREYHCATALVWTPIGKRKVGRPKTTWCCTVEKERAMAGWKSWEEARALAKDRS